MKLRVKPENDELVEIYQNHTHFHEGDSGYDLFTPEDIIVKPGLSSLVDLKIKCEAYLDGPNNTRHTSYYMYMRSSTAVKTPLRLANSVGIIDAGYRGSIKAVFDNMSDEDYLIEKGTRLLQLCGPTLEPINASVVNSLSNSSRGEGGFGSTDQTNNPTNL